MNAVFHKHIIRLVRHDMVLLCLTWLQVGMNDPGSTFMAAVKDLLIHALRQLHQVLLLPLMCKHAPMFYNIFAALGLSIILRIGVDSLG